MPRLLRRRFAILFYLYHLATGAFAQSVLLKGRVLDTAGRALPFSTIRIAELDLQTSTKTDGSFNLLLPGQSRKMLVTISHVGKETVTRSIIPGVSLDIILRDKSLTLAEVEVSVTRKGGVTPSSILFNREAIEQIQAFSLADVLNYLPGKAATPPSLQNPQTLTLRTEATGNHAMTNSLGAAIIIDGVRQSNDANMQGRSLAQNGMAGSVISNSQYGSFDVPFTGIDLRDIPVDNIEKIEVIQGVAPAQYGELTSGAVVITRQAGATQWQLNTRVNDGSTQFSLTKGFELGKKRGALNTTLTYLNSNEDPTNKVKSYSRVTGGLMWTVYLGGTKNTLSVDYNTKLDNVKEDPDDERLRKTRSINRNFSITNRTSIPFKDAWVDQLVISLSYKGGYQNTFSQYLMNQAPKGMATKDTTGVYEGYYLPGAYMSEEQVIGKPINVSADVNAASVFSTGSMTHHLSYGMNLAYADNKGEGIVVAADRPRWIDIKGQNARPYNYDLSVAEIFNAGFFVQNNMKLPLGGNNLQIGAGMRYNIMNGYGSFQPRLNAIYPINKSWDLTASYGISSKSPTLAHRYPAPAWLDIPLLQLYTGQPNQNLYLVYTQKVQVDNSNLKPARSSQAEAGIRHTNTTFITSLFFYAKRDRDGFNSYNKFLPVQVPEYNYTYTAGQPINYYPTGKTITYASTALYVVTNGLESDNFGAEWMMQIPKIRAIQTSFTLSHAFTLSRFKQGGDLQTEAVAQSYITAGSKALYGVYKPTEYENWAFMSKAAANTHIPSLGFIVSIGADFFWKRNVYYKQDTQIPVGYIDRDLQYIPIETFDPNNTDYNYLRLGNQQESTSTLQSPYVNFSMMLSKEIQKRLKISIAAFNFINAQSSYYNPATQTFISRREPLNLAASINLKF